MSTQRGARPVSAPVFSQAALAEAGIPMAPFDQPQTSTPIKVIRKEERRLEVTVEAVEPSKMEAATDKVQMLCFMFFFSTLSKSLKVLTHRNEFSRRTIGQILKPIEVYQTVHTNGGSLRSEKATC